MILSLIGAIAAFAFSIAGGIYPDKKKVLWTLGLIALAISCFIIYDQHKNRPPTIDEFNTSMIEIRKTLIEGFSSIDITSEESIVKKLVEVEKIPIETRQRLEKGSQFDKGLLAIYSGNFEEAKILLEEYLADNESTASIARAFLGTAFYYLKDFEGASKNYEISFKSNGRLKKHVILNNWGSALDKIGDYSEAIEKYKEAVELDPDYYYAWYNWGNALKNQVKYSEAVSKYEKALSFKPNQPEALNNLGFVLKQLGRTNEALEKYLLSVKHDPTNDKHLVNVGNTYYELKDYKNAIIYYSKANDIGPRNVKALINWGVTLCALNKCEEAISKYKLAEAIDPENATIYYNWGNALIKLNEPQEAIDKYKIATDLDPNDISAWRNWGKALIMLGRNDEGRPLIEKAQKLSERD